MKNSMKIVQRSLLSLVLLAGTAAYGQDNTAYGTGALNSGSGVLGSAFGFDTLYSNTGNDNSAFGAYALYFNTTGALNVAFGVDALYNNTAGYYNAGFGPNALYRNTTGYENTATGLNALFASNSCCNVADGYDALTEVTTGQANTGVGNLAGNVIDGSPIIGSSNTFLGTGTAMRTGTLTNATAIGANAEVDESNALVLGSVSGANGQRISVKVGIGTTRPDNNLTVDGTADKPGGGSWGTFSDGRLKTLDGQFDSGLRQILQISPVRYRYKPDNALGIHDSDEHVGLVAQDVLKVIPEAVTENGDGYLLLNNDPIIWTMLNAIKEQQKLIQGQQKQIAELSEQIKTVRASLKTSGRSVSKLHAVKADAPRMQE